MDRTPQDAGKNGVLLLRLRSIRPIIVRRVRNLRKDERTARS